MRTPSSTGLKGAHSETTGLKVLLRDVPKRKLKNRWRRSCILIHTGPRSVPDELPRDPPQNPCGGGAEWEQEEASTWARYASPGQVLRHSSQGLLLLGPVLGSGLVGHLQPQPLPAAWLQDLQSRYVGSLCQPTTESGTPLLLGVLLLPMAPIIPPIQHHFPEKPLTTPA